MILVLLGTQNNEFKRLLNEIERNIENGNITEEVIVQAGFTKNESNKMKIIDMIPKNELLDLVKKANLIITHGGVGSIQMALQENKKVIAVPRKSKYAEHVNDHQCQIVENFDKKGYLIGIDSVDGIEEALKKAKDFIPVEYKKCESNIINIIDKYLQFGVGGQKTNFFK